MPEAQEIAKAYLQPIRWKDDGTVEEISGAEKFYVQFNPQSLKVAYSNQKAGEGQAGTSAIQFVGRGTTKLSVELLFDATIPMPDGSTIEDVRELTLRVAKYMEPMEQEGGEDPKYVPPGLRFGWDTFCFEGVVDSINETLDYFGNDGKPLRGTVTLEVSRQEIKIEVSSAGVGTTAQHEVQDGETVQLAAANAGNQNGWQGVAAANGIENPRLPEAGALLNLSAGVGVSGGVGLGASAGFSAGAGLNVGTSASVSIGAANNLNLGVASSLGFGASSHLGQAAAGGGSGFGGASAGLAGALGGASLQAGASTGLSASASVGLGATTSGGTLIR